jgi:ComF family protein
MSTWGGRIDACGGSVDDREAVARDRRLQAGAGGAIGLPSQVLSPTEGHVNLKPRALVDYFTAACARLASAERCHFCAAEGGVLPVCAGCRGDLPWNAAACPGCALPLASASRCSACQRRPRIFDAAWAAFRFEAPIRDAVHALKYQAQFAQARLLAGLMAEALAPRRQPWPQLLLPVPLHPRRLRGRGYNQSQEIVRRLAAALALPYRGDLLLRQRATADQIGMNAVQRRRNLRGAFAVAEAGALQGLHIALVDDVMTTGATLEELARCCRRAGAVRIEAWAIARA